MFLDERVVLSSLVLLLCISVTPAPVSAAKDPIRVQSDEVLVPTVVFDKEFYAQLNKMKAHHRDSYGHIVTKNEKLWEGIAVKSLTAKDFHLFEDGQELSIQRVKLEPPAFRVVTDNLGKHPEIIGSGGGVWAYPDRPATDLRVWFWTQSIGSQIEFARRVFDRHAGFFARDLTLHRARLMLPTGWLSAVERVDG
jgi:hypothetical protein